MMCLFVRFVDGRALTLASVRALDKTPDRVTIWFADVRDGASLSLRAEEIAGLWSVAPFDHAHL